MKLTERKIQRVIAHEVGHVVLAILLGRPVFSLKVSNEDKKYKGELGDVSWGKSGAVSSVDSVIAVSGLVNEWVSNGYSPFDDWEGFTRIFRHHHNYLRDEAMLSEAEREGYGIRNAVEISVVMLHQYRDRVELLTNYLLKEGNRNRRIPCSQLLSALGVVVVDAEGNQVARKKVGSFLQGLIEDPQPCRYRLLEIPPQ